MDFHEVAEKICQDDKFKCVKINASQSREEVFKDIRKELEKMGPKTRLSILEDNMVDSREVCKKAALVAGLSAGIIASALYICEKKAGQFLNPLAAVTGIAGFSMVAASLYYLYVEE